ncbi:MAG TPA: hypothetical protein VNA23_06985 [Anaerolineales bacterium]|nr:hypothetical protein [Anaerolineales bacterium]
MPIVDIEFVLKPNEIIQSETVEELADQLGVIFGSPKGTTWVKVHTVEKHLYSENGGRPDGIFPVFVSVLKSILPGKDEMQREVEMITGAVAQIYGRPSGNVHVIYLSEGKGRVAFGGIPVL